MSIADNYIPVVEQGNGVTTIFTGAWNPVVVGYLRVYLEDVFTGVQTLQVLGVDYAAATVSTGGFRVTFFVAPTAAYNVVIVRVTAQNQDVPYRTSKGFDGANVEQSYDKLTAMVQELQDESNRALKFPLGSTSIGQIVGIPADETVLMFTGTGGNVTTGPSLTEIMNASAAAAAAALSAAAAAASAAAADMFAEEALQDSLLAQSWAIADIADRPEGSAKYWAGQAQLLATTGDYIVFGPTPLTSNQALGIDPIVLPADPKIAARVTLNIGGVMQIAGTDFVLDADPNTINLRIVGGDASMVGVVASGVVQLPSSLTNINAPSAGSVVETTLQNGAVTYAKMAAGAVSNAASTIANGLNSVLVTGIAVKTYIDSFIATYMNAQTWTVQLPNRVAGTLYTNSTGRPITVSVFGFVGAASTRAQLVVGTQVISAASSTAWPSNSRATLQAVVPNGATYQLQVTVGTFTPEDWSELR